jgi:hypothetical protein
VRRQWKRRADRAADRRQKARARNRGLRANAKGKREDRGKRHERHTLRKVAQKLTVTPVSAGEVQAKEWERNHTSEAESKSRWPQEEAVMHTTKAFSCVYEKGRE